MELYQNSAHALHELLIKKEVSSREITESVLSRIEDVEDKVGALLAVLPEAALEKASLVDEKIAKGEEIGALEGIPAVIKDNICTKDVPTTCASRMLENYKPPYNAHVAECLADSVMVAKANMDEFAMGSSTENSYFKKTKNPYSLDRVPGGSSGGSAAAIAADEGIFALGSDTGGSIRQPASFCGVVGLKPTYGLVSRYGLVAFASSLDQIGPITKDVTDAAWVLGAIAGHDMRDSTSLPYEKKDYTKALTGEVGNLKVGIPKEYMGEGLSDEVRAAIMGAVGVLESMGAKAEECSLPRAEYALPAYYIMSSAEASSNLARYDGVRYGFRSEQSPNVEEMFLNTRSEGFGEEVKRRIILGTYVLSSGYYDAYYKKAQKVRTLVKEDFDKAFEKYDVLITPTAPTTAWKIGEKSNNPLEMYTADICTVAVNVAGLPAIVIPCGYDKDGMPIGLQIIAKPLGEETLLRAAYAFEQATIGGKIRPTL